MHRIARFFLIAAAAAALPDVALAGAVDNKNNSSAEYVRHLSRNASVGTADAVGLNPAGVVAMKDGFYGNISNQTVLTDVRHEIGPIEYATDTPIPVLPHMYLLYKRDDWAAYFAFGIPGGGGSLEYRDGSATTEVLAGAARASGLDVALSLDVRSIYYGATFGGAYQINDIISVAAGLRYVYATFEVAMESDSAVLVAQSGGGNRMLDRGDTAQGFGGILSLNITPNDDLRLSLRYETTTRLSWTVDRRDIPPGIENMLSGLGLLASLGARVPPAGTEYRRDLPSYVAAGAAYRATGDLELSWSFNYYVHSALAQRNDLFEPSGETLDVNIWADDHDNGWETALGAEYDVDDDLLLSLGVNYADPGPKKRAFQPENPALSSISVGVGGMYRVADDFLLNVGFLGAFYSPETMPGDDLQAGTPDDIELTKKQAFILSLGGQYKFM